MATTEPRTGFRLPWSADRSSSREAGAFEDHVAVDGGVPDSSDPEGPFPAMEITPAAIESGDEPAQLPSADEAKSGIPPASEPAVEPVPPPQPARRPTKFLADLMKAMHAAAEAARTASLEQFRTDGKAFVEQIHARSSGQADDLRRRTDDDVAAIKDWSKAEIARVREETEAQITSRRRQLEGQLERHAALIEREIDKVQAKVTGYESVMGTFFDDLVGEEDPTAFAARAAQLPEPPSFEEIDEQALAELLAEPAPTVPVEAGAEPVAAGETESEQPEATAEPVEAAPLAEELPDREAAMAAIQAAAEAADAREASGIEASVDAEAPAATASGTDGGEPGDEPELPAESEADPRIALLGITPDFAAAEAEAAASASVAAGEGFEEMGEDSVSARLAGLVPAAGAGPVPQAAPTVTSQVVVVGLVSVASIASFKRHLGRLIGVAHVGVSSGPDGEFVFTVTHHPEVSLRDLVPTIPGFQARVTGTGDGIVNVLAHDPED